MTSYKKAFARFKSIKRGYYSFLFVCLLIFFALILEFFLNNRALVVKYQDNYYVPVISGFYSGDFFGLSYEYEVNYRKLQQVFQQENKGNWLIMPFIPYHPNESIFQKNTNPPYPPSLTHFHLIGTDTNGRDILVRLFYGFRIALFFSLGLYVITVLMGVVIGCLMGYFGGFIDLFFQRLVEMWASLPTLYIIIILAALITPSPTILMIILALVNWTGITYLMRAEIYREKGKQYCEAARSMGASHLRIIFRHLLPNSMVPLVAALPFQIIAGIGALTSLDYLGYGVPIPTASWGELLRQGQASFSYAPWILLAPAIATIFILLLFSFIGEALREALDPKQFNFYK